MPLGGDLRILLTPVLVQSPHPTFWREKMVDTDFRDHSELSSAINGVMLETFSSGFLNSKWR